MSELVGAVRSQAVDVLQEDLVVGRIQPGFGARELQPEAAEFARTEVHHQRVADRAVVRQQRKIGGRRPEAVHDDAVVDRAVAQPVVAIADAPARLRFANAVEDRALLCAVFVEHE